MKTEPEVKVLFGENKIILGTMYGKGVYELSPEVARVCVNHGGVVSADDKKLLDRLYSEAENENAPLSVEETVERMKAGDFSEEVFRSAQYHQAEISALMNPNAEPPLYGNIQTPAQTLVAAQTNPNLRESGEDAGNASNLGGNALGGEANGQTGGNAGGTANQTGTQTGGNSEGGAESDLPEDFPWRAELIAGGVTSLAKLKGMNKTQMLAIAGIGETRVNHIGARLAAMTENK